MRSAPPRRALIFGLLPALVACDESTENGLLTAIVMGLLTLGAATCDACAACWTLGGETAPYLTDGGSMACDGGRLEGFLREADRGRRPAAHLEGRRVGSFAVQSDRRATFSCEDGRTYVVRFER